MPTSGLWSALLSAAVIALGVLLYRQESAIRSQERQIAALTATPKAEAYPLEFQERCAEQARKSFKELGYKTTDMASYESHYNARIKKCFIQVAYSDANAQSRNVSDAYEGKSYAEYMFISDKVKKYWEVKPFICRATLLTGESQQCQSTDEFDELIKVYMEG
jgi:hypothetical protein